MENLQRGFGVPIMIAMIVLVVVVGGAAYFFIVNENTPSDSNIIEKMEGVTENKETGMMVQKDDTGMMQAYSGTVLAGTSAPLLDFTKADYEAALKTDKLIVLYFYANWCPICRAEFPVMQEAFNDLTTDAVVGFRVNYNDNQTDANEKNLAREFGVAYQHTKVFVKNGKQVLKSPESWDKNRYESEINTYSQ